MAVDVVLRLWQGHPAVWYLNGNILSFADGHAEHWTWYEARTLTIPGYYYPALNPTDKVFDRMAAAYAILRN